jgi:hypothetical protein
MQRIIIFRFHKDPGICTRRLRLLKKYNPEVPVFGLYGGRPGGVGEFGNLRSFVEGVYSVENETSDWKWKNSDLALRRWFESIGKNVDFDMLHLIEWDLLLFGGLDNIYRDIPSGVIGLTGLTDLENVRDEWAWTSREPYRSEWEKLLDYAASEHNYYQKPFASLGPGYCLPRAFLERYCTIDVPAICHDELRLPLFGQILGFELRDTGFYKKWFDKNEQRVFNCMDMEIGRGVIVDELQKPDGRRVFHPYRSPEDFLI